MTIEEKIKSLKEKTVERGCSEAEARAAKELLKKLYNKYGIPDDTCNVTVYNNTKNNTNYQTYHQRKPTTDRAETKTKCKDIPYEVFVNGGFNALRYEMIDGMHCRDKFTGNIINITNPNNDVDHYCHF